MVPVVLLTPLMLAADPVKLTMPQKAYDHRTQTSGFDHNLARTFTSSHVQKSNGKSDLDTDYGD
jgi:hypothetical protein